MGSLWVYMQIALPSKQSGLAVRYNYILLVLYELSIIFSDFSRALATVGYSPLHMRHHWPMGKTRYSIFNQSKMRAHLYQCFMKGRLTPFPCTKRYLGVDVPGHFKPKCRDDIEVHCHCRMPELKDVPMIECTKCNKWFHIDCEAVPGEILDNSRAEWFCKHCMF